ncbi:hypothetical protein HYT23_04185 [Candidatus Pacearchaeota archaeon]|nr:hypothetical protein [Candidatus Pacearchaeota archaeon]
MAEFKWMLIIALGILLSAMMLFLYYTIEKTQKQGQQEYLACGCGCCENSAPEIKCLNYSKGERIIEFSSEDNIIAQGSNCETANCVQGIKYVYCD